MSQQQHNQLNYYRTAADNMYRFYNELYQLSRLNYNDTENVGIVMNYFKNLGDTAELRGISNTKELKELVIEKMNLYLKLAEDNEKKYDSIFEKKYFEFSVNQVG